MYTVRQDGTIRRQLGELDKQGMHSQQVRKARSITRNNCIPTFNGALAYHNLQRGKL